MKNETKKLIITTSEVDERIARGIEENRKGNFTLQIIDADGKILKNAKVSVIQKKHKFRFGANIFMLNEFEEDWKNEAYKEKFKKLFNIATLPFIGTQPSPNREKLGIIKAPKKCIEDLRSIFAWNIACKMA